MRPLRQYSTIRGLVGWQLLEMLVDLVVGDLGVSVGDFPFVGDMDVNQSEIFCLKQRRQVFGSDIRIAPLINLYRRSYHDWFCRPQNPHGS